MQGSLRTLLLDSIYEEIPGKEDSVFGPKYGFVVIVKEGLIWWFQIRSVV